MDTAIFILILEIIILVVIGYIAKSYLPSYFREKGRNLATKEDIAEITKKIEGIKHEFRQNLSQ